MLAAAAALLALGSLIVAVRQAALARKQTSLAAAQTSAATKQTDVAVRQLEMAEREHAAFLAELERVPILTASVSHHPDFVDGNVRKPRGARWDRRIEVAIDNSGSRAAENVLVNVVAPMSLPGFKLTFAGGEPLPGAEPAVPVPSGYAGVTDAHGRVYPGKYLNQELTVHARAIAHVWANFTLTDDFDNIPFRITVDHPSLEKGIAIDFAVNVDLV